jgi:molybdate transport system substrate-binding protein
MWTAVESQVARAKDVRAALALVERGEAPLGLVYATDAAISSKVRVVGTFPETSHPPIVYPVAVVAGKQSPATERFMTLLQSAEAKAVFEKYGFAVR